jgi:hypothetical protein
VQLEEGVYIGTLEASQIIGVSAALLRTWRSEGRGPEFVRLGHSTIVYRQTVVEEFARNREANQ